MNKAFTRIPSCVYMMTMIQIKSLRIDYDEVTAVSDLNLTVPSGQVYGLVGPNGAGKTSTIKACAGIIEATYGEIEVDGVDLELRPEQALAHVGYMPDFSPVYDNLKVWEYLDVFAAAYHIPRQDRLTKVKYWINQVNLDDKYNSFIKGLSRGMKQRLVLAKTLLPDPKVLLLDEPASGLDPIARKEMRDVLKRVAEQGKAIIISSHILTELSEFCNAIGIMEKGKLVVSGTLEDIRAKMDSKGRLIVRLAQTDELTLDKTAQFLKASQFVHELTITKPHELTCAFSGKETDSAWLLAQLIKQDIPVSDFYIEPVTVEDIFFKIGANQVS
jgi:ABC-2 type transport system ATP-binding protein